MTRTLVKYPPIPCGNNVVVSSTTSSKGNSIYVALRYETKIEIWKLGQSLNVNLNGEKDAPNSVWKNKYLPLKEDAKKILTLNSKDNTPIMNFDMAYNGSVLAYLTTDSSIRIFEMDLETNNEDNNRLPKITRIPFKSQKDLVADGHIINEKLGYNIVKCLSSPELGSKTKILLSTYGGTLQCYELTIGHDTDPSVITLLWSLSPRECLDIHSGISYLEAHPNGLCCAIASYDGTVRLINMLNAKTKKNITNNTVTKPTVHKVPFYNLAIVSSMAFSPKSDGNLIIVYANHHFVEVESASGHYTDFTNKMMNLGKKYRQLPKEWSDKQFSTKAISFIEDTAPHSKENELIVFYDEANICTFDKRTWFSNILETNSTNISIKSETNGPSTKSAKKNKGKNKLNSYHFLSVSTFCWDTLCTVTYSTKLFCFR